MNNTVDDIYTTHNIDKSKLKRDYIKIPLKKLPRNGGGIDILCQLQSKATLMISKGKKNTQYLRAIKVWSKTDPLKREIAKKNNLNWIEFFNMNQFLDWFNMQ